jgi:hypothetical protein
MRTREAISDAGGDLEQSRAQGGELCHCERLKPRTVSISQ